MVIQKNNSNSISLTVSILKKNEVVIIPTDTIYGFSGILNNTKEKIAALKNRDSHKQFITLISEPHDIFKYSESHIPEKILNIWPAPLTIIVKSKLNNKETCAFRCPADKWLREIIQNLNSPIYSTSVNISGTPALTNIDEIKKAFENKIALIVDDGNKTNGASTILDLSGVKPKILRQGSLELKI